MNPVSSSPLGRAIVIAVPAMILALMLGAQLGKGSWLLPIGLAGGGVLLALYVLFFRAVTLDTLALGAILFGYIVGNRGFAQLHLGNSTPLYLGELTLVVCAGLLAVRFAIRRKRIIPKTELAWAILAFLLLGAIRLCLDAFFEPGFISPTMAIRDAATVYYASFFFVAFKLGENESARRILERCVLAACILLLPITAIYIFDYQDIFNGLAIRGFPLIAQKGDLLTTYLAFASFYFFLRPAKGGLRIFYKSLSLIFGVAMIAATSRAGLFGFCCAAILLLIARRPQFIFYQIATGIIALIIIGLLQMGELEHKHGHLGRILDRVESMVDVSGSHSYREEIGESSAQNNQFRLVWWKSVIDETVGKAPWFGLGFGYDLAKKFLISYDAPLNTYEFDTRSPHSVWVTIFGRMGALGITCFVIVGLLIIRDAVRAARRVARGKADPSTLAHWCAAIILLGSASFGVVLEGPMGGILFWTFLGLACSQTQVQEEAVKESKSPARERTRFREPLTAH